MFLDEYHQFAQYSSVGVDHQMYNNWKTFFKILKFGCGKFGEYHGHLPTLPTFSPAKFSLRTVFLVILASPNSD